MSAPLRRLPTFLSNRNGTGGTQPPPKRQALARAKPLSKQHEQKKQEQFQLWVEKYTPMTEV